MVYQTSCQKENTCDPLRFRGHIPGLDGLRGVAIIMVLLCHFYYPAESFISALHPLIGPVLLKATSACAFGVELFFVISGFLITGILLDSRKNTNYFKVFYMRRILRIFPIYYAALCFIFVLLPRVYDIDAAAQNIGSRQIWLWIYLSNAPWSGWGWDSSTLYLLGHFWSLCVEEHFYVMWPFAVYVFDSRRLARVCLLGLGFCFSLRVWHALPASPSILGWSTLTKLDGLFVGALLALGCRDKTIGCRISRLNLRSLWGSGLVTILLLGIPRNSHGAWWDVVIELPCVIFCGSILVKTLSSDVGKLQGLLHNNVLRSFGKYSYGIYVIHFICLPSFQRLFQHDWLLSSFRFPMFGQIIFYALTISSSYLLAFGSWHLMEKHFLSLKRHFSYESPPGAIAG